jgi:hypothetical protein
MNYEAEDATMFESLYQQKQKEREAELRMVSFLQF